MQPTIPVMLMGEKSAMGDSVSKAAERVVFAFCSDDDMAPISSMRTACVCVYMCQ